MEPGLRRRGRHRHPAGRTPGSKGGNRPSLEMVVPAGALSEGGSHDCPTFSFRGAFKKP